MKKMGAKAVVVALAGVLAIGGAVGGTLAWLTDTTGEVVNTFSVGKVEIDLTETSNDGFKIIPGNAQAKDPVVSVKNGSEECWLFVEVKATNTNGYVTWEMRDVAKDETATTGWKLYSKTPVDDPDNTVDGTYIYYRIVSSEDANQGTSFYLLTGGMEENMNGQVSYSDKLTKEVLESASNVSLTFKAYAVQKANVGTADEAWAIVDPESQSQ